MVYNNIFSQAHRTKIKKCIDQDRHISENLNRSLLLLQTALCKSEICVAGEYTRTSL